MPPLGQQNSESEDIDEDEEEAAEVERMLGGAFRYLKDRVGNEGEEALLELEKLIYGDVDLSAGETDTLATGLHIRAIGVWSTELICMEEVASDPEALEALRFILESSILDVGEYYDVKGQSSDTALEEGMLFAENVISIQLRSAQFVGINLYSAAFDQLEDKTIHADGTCTPALQFEDTDTSEVFDIQLLRVAELSSVFDEGYMPQAGNHDSWRQRYDDFLQAHKNRRYKD